MTTTDEPLHLARRQLGDAVHALADPAPEWVDGVCRWSDSVYVRLRRELAGGKPIGRGAAQRSRAPCSIGVLALLVDIDTTVAAWESDATGTTERLHQLAERGWRPQDCDLLAGYCDRLQRWVVAAAELLGREPRVSLEVPCPRCEARFAYRRNGVGESVRVWALRVSENGCECLACSAFWPPERFEWLARLLGCPALPA